MCKTLHQQLQQKQQETKFTFTTPIHQRLHSCIEQLGGGWVAEEALAITIFVGLVFENDFTKGVLAAVNHSGDSDTTGSMVGQLLGVMNGIEAIPTIWIDNLIGADIVDTICNDIHERTFERFNPHSSFEGEKKYWDRYPGW